VSDVAFVRAVRRGTWCALALLGVLAAIAPRVARAAVIGLTATIGIAHGATDAPMLERLGVRPRGGKRTLSIAYGAFAIAVYALARRAPKRSARILRIVSWAHFGSGDAAFARACGSARFELAETLVRGAVPLCVAGTGTASARALVATALFAGLDVLRGDVADAADVLLPALVLYGAPVRLGFGAYFAAWHAPRHLALLLSRDPRGGPYAARLGRFVREAAGNSAIASGFALLAYVMRADDTVAEDLAAALILAITVPHQAAVWTIEVRSRSGRRS
jgi:hypothetical protein